MKLLVRAAMWINALLLPLSGIPFAVAFGMLYGGAFIVPITVTNRTSSAIEFTPVSVVGQEIDRCFLPMSASRYVDVPDGERADIRVAPEQTRVVYYDHDDVNFSELVVKTTDGTLFELVANPNPHGRQYIPAPVTTFVITPAALTTPVTPAVRAGYVRATAPSRSFLWLWGALLVSIVPLVAFPFTLKAYRSRTRQSGCA